MARRTLIQKLEILADAAKYDASCASSGSRKRNSVGTNGIGSTEGMGICHSYAPDGRCISLLKILLTNFCIFDCRYCINRSSSNVQRERFSVKEVVKLTLDFYKRNYIEGLFLSSGIIRSPNYTMEQLLEVARSLREDHGFRGYIHLKTIAEADPELIRLAGKHADRLSVNVELPSEQGLTHYAPEKSGQTIRKTMADIRYEIDNVKDAKASRILKRAKPPAFAPGGQSTQMIVGADASSDADILNSSARLYAGYGLKRVYYSAYSPVPDASADLPPIRPPLIREHRLYQADWMFRFYGFTTAEITSVADNGMLDLDVDPKLSWALRNRGLFPMDVNRASYQELLRIPGLGPTSAKRIVAARRHTRLTLDDLGRIVRSLKTVRPFITASGWSPGKLTDTADLKQRFLPAPKQLDLFT
ncbi:putative DNA modification/repair radical SAM protein [Hyphomonas atlantica corrig.]|uniref:putative DNA modification/repair radical SAM protein n=1 Tax=Hyphomonas atlantica TaxID=1280948 RepID=UPI0023538D47|nr:putative DNA modification/repair radical SAM protein [Hyphomonas atlantica]